MAYLSPRKDGEIGVHVFQMGQVDGDMVVARDVNDAWRVWCDETGEKREDYDTGTFNDFGGWVQWPDDQPLTIVEADEPGQPSETQTGAGWAEKNGRGFLASTEY